MSAVAELGDRLSKLTIAEAWAYYEPINRRDNEAWQSEAGRARHFIRRDRGAASGAHVPCGRRTGDCRRAGLRCP